MFAGLFKASNREFDPMTISTLPTKNDSLMTILINLALSFDLYQIYN
jgi:hypothetical protein